MGVAFSSKLLSKMNLYPLTPSIGVEISGIDLRKTPDTNQIAIIHQALLDYKVIFFRDQNITAEQHINFAKCFGDLEIHPATPADQKYPEILRITHDRNSRGSENMWHSDVTWRAKPSLGSILRAVELPPTGGDTLFCDMCAAYDGLSEELKNFSHNLIAVHDIARVFARRLNKTPEELHEKYPPQEHPVIRTHPETGRRLLYVNGAFTSHIKGLASEESDWLLKHLYAQAMIPEYQCRFKWAENSIAFWDNRACQHYAVSDYFPLTRVMERVTIAGDQPYFVD